MYDDYYYNSSKFNNDTTVSTDKKKINKKKVELNHNLKMKLDEDQAQQGLQGYILLLFPLKLISMVLILTDSCKNFKLCSDY